MFDILQTDVAKMREHWFHLASRATRVLILRKGLSYRELASALSEIGVKESERSVEGKIHRGTFPFTFFLQVLIASKADYPHSWRAALEAKQTWEERASSIIQRTLAEQPWLTYEALSRSFQSIGVLESAASLHVKFRDATLSTALFLQYATIRRLDFAHCFLDWSDLDNTAAYGGQLFKAGVPVTIEPRVPTPRLRRWQWKRFPSR